MHNTVFSEYITNLLQSRPLKLASSSHLARRFEIHSYFFWRACGPPGGGESGRGHLALRQGTASPAPLIMSGSQKRSLDLAPGRSHTRVIYEESLLHSEHSFAGSCVSNAGDWQDEH